MLSLLSYGGDFTYLRSWEGLPDGEINAIVQDSSGNMWMATWSGLIKFDGYHYVVYRPELGKIGSLHDKKVKDLLVDSRNNLWVVTSRYLFLFDSNSNTFTEVEFDNEISGSITILQIVEIDNSIWVNSTAGLFTFQLNDVPSGNLRFKKSKVIENGTGLYEFYYRISAYNNMLILCQQYPGEPTKLIFGKPYFNNGNSEIKVLSKDFMNTTINSVIFVPQLDRLFYGTSEGLYSVSGSNVNSKKEVQFEKQEIQKLFYASNNYLYAATTGPELKYIDLHTGNTGGYRANPDKEGTLLNNNILSVYEDFSNNLWIGHQGQGISILNLNRKAFKTF
jgi:ligand-binding sensor domain-containing protein